MLNGTSNMTMDPPTTAAESNETTIPPWLDTALQVLGAARYETNETLAAVAEFSVRGAPSTHVRFTKTLERLIRRLEAERQANDNATVSIWREVLRGQAISDARQMTSDQFAALMLRDAVARERNDGG
jgi:hypothetical protein